jgi:hypothetical protein
MTAMLYGFLAVVILIITLAVLSGGTRKAMIREMRLEEEKRAQRENWRVASLAEVSKLRWKAGLWDRLMHGIDEGKAVNLVLEDLIKEENQAKREEEEGE